MHKWRPLLDADVHVFIDIPPPLVTMRCSSLMTSMHESSSVQGFHQELIQTHVSLLWRLDVLRFYTCTANSIDVFHLLRALNRVIVMTTLFVKKCHVMQSVCCIALAHSGSLLFVQVKGPSIGTQYSIALLPLECQQGGCRKGQGIVITRRCWWLLLVVMKMQWLFGWLSGQLVKPPRAKKMQRLYASEDTSNLSGCKDEVRMQQFGLVVLTVQSISVCIKLGMYL